MASEASLAAPSRTADGVLAPSSTPPREAHAEAVPAGEPKEEAPPTVQDTIRMVGRKWHLILLWELSQDPAGFNELKQRADGISAKMLSQSLSDLEESGLVVRDIITEKPLRTMYHLTEKAMELTAIFDILDAWGRRHGHVGARTEGQ